MDISGPSPIIPFVLVATLALLLHGRSVMEDISLVADPDDTAHTLVLAIPLLVLLSIYFTTQSLIIPLALMLVMYAVSKMFLGPLLLILAIYVFSVYAPSFDTFQRHAYSYTYGSQACDQRDRDDSGWGWALLLAGFLGLNFMFSEELDQWVLVLAAVAFFVLYNLQNLAL